MLTDTELAAIEKDYEGGYADIHALLAEIRRQRGILRYIGNMDAMTANENRIKQLAAQSVGQMPSGMPQEAQALDSGGVYLGDGPPAPRNA